MAKPSKIDKEVAKTLLMSAFVGRVCKVKYWKTDRKTGQPVWNYYFIVPMNASVNKYGKVVIYVQDTRDRGMTKMFFRDNFETAELLDEPAKPFYSINKNMLERYLGRLDDEEDARADQEAAGQDGRGAGALDHGLRVMVARELCRMAMEIMEFSGSEAFKDDPESYGVVGDDGR